MPMSTLSLLNTLCNFLNCNPQDLELKLQDPFIRMRVDECIKNLKIFTNYKDTPKPIKYAGLSFEGANKLMAYGGYLKITVQQHYYASRRVKLMHPKLQCIMESHGNGQFSYFPLETLIVL